MIIDPDAWPLIQGGEKLRRYQLRPGVYVQLTEAQAQQRGLVAAAMPTPPAPEGKKRAPVNNKKRAPAPNKGGEA